MATFSLEKFVDLLKARNSELRILRIYSKAIERKDFPSPKHYDRQHKSDTSCPDWARPYALHYLIRQKDGCTELKELESGVKHMEQSKRIASGKVCIRHRKVK